MLTFNDLAQANRVRCESKFHALDAWSPTDWACAMAGECGEACNLVKKIRRLQSHPSWAPQDADRDLVGDVADELADVVIYADLLAQRLGLSLGEAVARKFNVTSRKVGSDVFLKE